MLVFVRGQGEPQSLILRAHTIAGPTVLFKIRLFLPRGRTHADHTAHVVDRFAVELRGMEPGSECGSAVHAALRGMPPESHRGRRSDARRDGGPRPERDRRDADGRHDAPSGSGADPARARRDRGARHGSPRARGHGAARPRPVHGEPPFAVAGSSSSWNGWGPDVRNTRFQRDAGGITAANVGSLKLKWAFGVADVTQSRSQPAIVGGRLFMASQSGVVYALDPKSGCTLWTYKARSGVRTAVSVGPVGPANAPTGYARLLR